MLIQANDHRSIHWRILVLYVLCGMHVQCCVACCMSAECQLGALQHPKCAVARLTPYTVTIKQSVHLKTLCKTPHPLCCPTTLLQLAMLASTTASPAHHTAMSDGWCHTHPKAWSTHLPWQDPYIPSTYFHATN